MRTRQSNSSTSSRPCSPMRWNDIREAVPILADLLSIPVGERYPPLDLSPQQRKEKTFQALFDQLNGLAARQPTLAIYEDVHWADPTTIELLGRIFDRVQRLPVLRCHLSARICPALERAGAYQHALTQSARAAAGQAIVERLTGGRAFLENCWSRSWPELTGCRCSSKNSPRWCWNRAWWPTRATISSSQDHYSHLRSRRPCTIR